jgi:hypothetical protein
MTLYDKARLHTLFCAKVFIMIKNICIGVCMLTVCSLMFPATKTKSPARIFSESIRKLGSEQSAACIQGVFNPYIDGQLWLQNHKVSIDLILAKITLLKLSLDIAQNTLICNKKVEEKRDDALYFLPSDFIMLLSDVDDRLRNQAQILDTTGISNLGTK